MRLSALIFATGTLVAQTPAPGLVRGSLLECETGAANGSFSVRTATNEVFRFTFDARTYFEREKQREEPSRLAPGELVEVVADRGAGIRYARTVHVVEMPTRPRPAASALRPRTFRVPFDHLIPAGNLTYSGILQRVSAERIVLRTRDGADRTILLRQDTRFLDGGEIADLRNLQPNMRVFVRAGKDLYGEVEAFQIVRGAILQPGQ